MAASSRDSDPQDLLIQSQLSSVSGSIWAPQAFGYSYAGSETESKPRPSQYQPPTRNSSRVSQRPTGACTHCKSLKARCQIPPGESSCVRCTAGNWECVVRGRKKRRPAPTHEELEAQSRTQDMQIQSLLEQLDQLRAVNKMKQWTSRLQGDAAYRRKQSIVQEMARFTQARGNTSYDADELEFINLLTMLNAGTRINNAQSQLTLASSSSSQGYAITARDGLPYIVTCGLLQASDFVELLRLYFEKINPYCMLLDRALHTPRYLVTKAPFLFSVLCALALRYCTRMPHLYEFAMEVVEHAATGALENGLKTIEMCQAYILLSLYPVPQKRWSDDRRWLIIGVAVALARELQLQEPSPPKCDEREKLNRTRTWLTLVTIDHSHALQFGKPPMVQLDGYIMRLSKNWYQMSPMNLPFDIHICHHVDMLVLMEDFRLSMEQNQNFDIVSVALHYNQKMKDLASSWVSKKYDDMEKFSNADHSTQTLIMTFEMLSAFLRLVILSRGLQDSIVHGLPIDSQLMENSIEAAQTAIRIMTDCIYPQGVLGFCAESLLLYAAFAAAFLINLLCQSWLSLSHSDPTAIISCVEKLAGILGSNDVSVNRRHAPAIYAKFLFTLLENRRAEMSGGGADTSEYLDSNHPWPETYSLDYHSPSHAGLSSYNSQDTIADTDFTLAYFTHTVDLQTPSSTAGTSSPELAYPSPSESPPPPPQYWTDERAQYCHYSHASAGPSVPSRQ